MSTDTRRRVVFGDPRCDRPSLGRIASLLGEHLPKTTRWDREQLASVIRKSRVSGTLVGFAGHAVSWRWVGGCVEMEVEPT